MRFQVSILIWQAKRESVLVWYRGNAAVSSYVMQYKQNTKSIHQINGLVCKMESEYQWEDTTLLDRETRENTVRKQDLLWTLPVWHSNAINVPKVELTRSICEYVNIRMVDILFLVHICYCRILFPPEKGRLTSAVDNESHKMCLHSEKCGKIIFHFYNSIQNDYTSEDKMYIQFIKIYSVWDCTLWQFEVLNVYMNSSSFAFFHLRCWFLKIVQWNSNACHLSGT